MSWTPPRAQPLTTPSAELLESTHSDPNEATAPVSLVDVHCPQCGYPLKASIAGRCSECGFGYDYQAVEKLAIEYAHNRVGSFQTAVALAALAALCFVVARLPTGVSDWVGRLLIVVGMLAFSTTRKARFSPVRFAATSILVALAGVAVLSDGLVKHIGVVSWGFAMTAGLWHRASLRFLQLSVPPREHERVSRYRRVFGATVTIAGALGVWAIAL